MQGNFPRKNGEKWGVFCTGQLLPPSGQHVRQPEQHAGANDGDQEGGEAPIGVEADEGEEPVAQGEPTMPTTMLRMSEVRWFMSFPASQPMKEPQMRDQISASNIAKNLRMNRSVTVIA